MIEFCSLGTFTLLPAPIKGTKQVSSGTTIGTNDIIPNGKTIGTTGASTVFELHTWLPRVTA